MRARTNLALLFAMACCLAAANGADWLSVRGDAQRTGWQPDERHLTPKTVKSMRLLWKKQLGADAVSPPMLLGPIVTHRGIKELVFVESTTGRVSAVDADLGRVFWSRDLAVKPAPKGCPAVAPVSPAMLSSVAAAVSPVSSNDDDDEFSDGSRPLRVVTADGSVHALRASTGEDVAPPGKFSGQGPSMFAGFGEMLFAGWGERAPAGCDDPRPRLEAIRADGLGAAPVMRPESGVLFGIAAGIHGALYASIDGPKAVVGLVLASETLKRKDTLSLRVDVSKELRLKRGRFPESQFLDSTILVFPWQRGEMAASVSSGGQLILWRRGDGDAANSTSAIFDGLSSHDPANERWSALGGLATWAEASGERWLCLITTDGDSRRLLAFRVLETNGKPDLKLAWRSETFMSIGAPVVGAGVVYFMANGGKGPALTALDAKTGALLLSTSEGLEASEISEGVALANGHLCFTSAEGTLYCFGLPLEI